MNPVLLKPGSDHRSHVVLMGRPGGEVHARDFVDGRRRLAEAAHAAFDDLVSPLRRGGRGGGGQPGRDQPAREATTSTWGWPGTPSCRRWWSATSTVAGCSRRCTAPSRCSSAADQRLVAGFVVNKFRGDDDAAARPGSSSWSRSPAGGCTACCRGIPTLWLDSEDALDLEGRRSTSEAALRVAVVRLPRISNFTDVDALGLEPDVDVVFASDPGVWRRPTSWCCPAPGRRMADLAWLRSRGLDTAVVEHARAGRPCARDLRRLPDARRTPSTTRTASRASPERARRGSGCSTSAPASAPRRHSGCRAVRRSASRRAATRSTTAA